MAVMSPAPIAEIVSQLAIKRLHARTTPAVDPFAPYQFEPAQYITDKLGWSPWRGTPDYPGQHEVIDAYTLALRQQHERDRYEAGDLGEADLQWYSPGQPIQNRIRVEAGHGTGKTKVAAGLVNHFFDCFPPSLIYTFAPSWKQIHDLLWKEIKADRTGKGLPGRILDLRLERAPDHFVEGRATNNDDGTGSERIQGQHGKYLMFVLDEAEGIPDFVWNAVDSMTSGGISIVLMLANPRTRTSEFHKQAARSTVRSFRISCLHHPNVLAGRELVPGAVRRQYVDEMLEKHADVVPEHDADRQTFEVPWQPGTVYAPDAEFMFRVLGVAPLNMADNTLIPVGRYLAAQTNEADETVPHVARLGVDVARWGADLGTLYVRHRGRVWRAAQFAQKDTTEYARRIRQVATALAADGVTNLHIRIDGGGGFGGGVIDQLVADLDLIQMFGEFVVWEVHFGGTPYDHGAYANLATEMYAAAGEALLSLRVENPPAELEDDLCARAYRWAQWQAMEVKRLEPKDDYKKRAGRSPDDGDGFVLAVSPDYLFDRSDEGTVVYDAPEEISPI